MNQRAIDESTKYLHSWLKFRYESQTIPGFVVAVSHQGKIVFNEAFGYSDLEKKTTLKPDDIFRISSQSKTFTATAIMQLQDNNKLHIDDLAINYLDWLKGHNDKRFQNITLRQLLSHGAGLIRDGKNADYWQLDREFPDVNQFKNEILDTKLVFDGNVQMKYSNYGYGLLGLIVEAVSGVSYNDYVTKNIINRLGLFNTGPEYSAEIEPRLVTGYTRPVLDKKRLPIDTIVTNALSPAAGFYSNATDLCTYFSAQLIESGQLLTDTSKQEMQRTQLRVNNTKDNEEYGLGLEIEYSNDKRLFGHEGFFPGQITVSLCDPKNGLVVVALTNCVDGDAENIAKGVMSVMDYFAINTNDEISKHNLQNLTGRYMSLWGIKDIIAIGDSVISVFPDAWQPFSDIEELEYINDTTFKIQKTNGYNSEGEEIKFNIENNGKINSVIYAGVTMLPKKEWTKQISGKKKISPLN